MKSCGWDGSAGDDQPGTARTTNPYDHEFSTLGACRSPGGAAAAPDAERSVPLGQVAAESAIPGNVWNVLAEPGMKIEPGQAVVAVESMTMEMMVRAVTGGVVRETLCRTGKTVQAGQWLLVLKLEI